MIEEETVLYKASTSQIVNLKNFTLSIILIAGVIAACVYFKEKLPAYSLAVVMIPILSTVWRFLRVKCLKYELTTERLRIVSGVFNRTTEEIELYRVKDSTIEEPFFYRLMGIGNINLETSDRSLPSLTIKALPKAKLFRENLRDSVEKIRVKKNVREVDYE